jgi:hypothetical protein
MRWEIACSDFMVGALSKEGPRISAMAIWHRPEASQIQQYPEFELFEEEVLFGYSASVDFRCGGPNDAKRCLLESWRHRGVQVESDWDFRGSLFLNDSHLSFSFYLPEEQMAALQGTLLMALATPKQMNMMVRLDAGLIIGDLSISVQPNLKAQWMNGEIEIGLVGCPNVSLVFGELVKARPAWSDILAIHTREI